MATQIPPARCAFGPFEVDIATGDLRKNGVRVRLSGQPFRVLTALLARPGELTTREQLKREVWTDSTFVDFDHGLNAVMNKLRRALGDVADNPRYIETQSGRGYRFIGTIDGREVPSAPLVEPSASPERAMERRTFRRWWWLAGRRRASFRSRRG
jgi:DNA-binding winged helix-turn-helix (wHTH) protein